MARVTGIGGIFFKFKDVSSIKEWYQDILGMTVNNYGVLFEYNSGSSDKAYLQLGTFEESTDYFGDKNQQSMINFRVDDLDSLLTILKSKNVKIVDHIESYSYGKFLHIEDPEGNRIELWEPIDSEFTASSDPKMSMK
ncbi:MAG: VOC family protein [Crocinitomicaceae bacterium]|nr:VOC family protein [Crocinitomicaceae bacterium]